MERKFDEVTKRLEKLDVGANSDAKREQSDRPGQHKAHDHSKARRL